MPKGKPKFGTPPRDPIWIFRRIARRCAKRRLAFGHDLPLPFTDDPTGGADPFDKRVEDANDENDLCLDDWEVIYEAPDNLGLFRWDSNLEPEERRNRRLTFHNTYGWRPNKDIMDMLQRVGEDNYPGTKSVVLDVDSWGDILR